MLCRSLILFVVAFVGCGTSNPPSSEATTGSEQRVESKRDRATSDGRKLDNQRPAPEVKVITLGELADVMEKNDDLAEFQSSTVEVTATVSAITDVPLFVCDAGYRPVYFGINPKDAQPWARIAPGQRVTLRRGRVPWGFIWDIVSFGPNPAPIVTAPALAEEFRNEGLFAKQRYSDQPLYVTGVVLEKEINEKLSSMQLILGTQGSLKVGVYFPVVRKSTVDSVEVGDVIYAQAEVRSIDSFSASEGTLMLHYGLLITTPFPVRGVQYAESMASRHQERAIQLQNQAPEFKVDAKELQREVREDSKAAAKKYTKRVMDVSGEIEAFTSHDSSDGMYVRLADGRLYCKLLEEEPWRSYAPGQRVTIRGRYANLHALPDYFEGVVVSSEPHEAPLNVYTSEELVSSFLHDRESKENELKDRPLIVTGRLEALGDDRSWFRLQGINGNSILCKVSDEGTHREKLFRHAIGDQVRILAILDAVNLSQQGRFIVLKDAWERPVLEDF